tara:strand:+ start:365 stop:1159 length:795 start_codon:yes stop_codon:yes gene_type:complete
MAKKKEVKEAVEQLNVMEKPLPKKDKWVIRDRVYTLKDNRMPLSKSIRSANLYWFDEKLGYEREIKYCENQRTPFTDEMKGDQRLSHIVFRSGQLFVPKNKVTLQKFLSLYHPHRNKVYEEQNLEKKADNQLDWLEFEIAALNAAQSLDIDMMEAVMRVEIGSNVTKMSSSELKRDLLLFAKREPQLFLELVTDENIQLRNFAVKACEVGLIELSQDQRTFSWKSTGRKLMTVPFDENPYSALAAWFKTDEGVEVFSQIEKRLK